MKTHPLWLLLDGLTGLLVHGLLCLFVAPLAGWPVWAALTIGAAAVGVARSWRLNLPGRSVRRAVLAGYFIAVSVPALLSWVLVAFFSIGLWLVIGLACLAIFWLVCRDLTPIAGLIAATVLSALVFVATEARLSSDEVMALATAAGLTLLLLTIYADRLAVIGKPLFLVFFLAASAMGANDFFYHGTDIRLSRIGERPGVETILAWNRKAAAFVGRFGTDLRFAQRNGYGDLVVGGDRGVFLARPFETVQLPVGPAADNFAVDPETKDAYLPTRDGRIARLSSPEMDLGEQQKLARGALVARRGGEGIYVADEWTQVRLFEPQRLLAIRDWHDGPISDLLADPAGGFFLSTLTGKLRRYSGDSIRGQAELSPLGLFHLLAIDPATARLFVGNMAGKKIQVFRTDTLAPLGEVPVDRGIRNLYWDDSARVLWLGSYFRGDLIALDGESLREIGRLFVGRRIRSIAPNGDGRLLVLSAGGIVIVDPRPVLAR
ncbi:MAG: hypothetical protein GX444_21330 [Myxococcales bacterium]|nr:hypothetical protein [Myxococcales bacterium]